MGLIDRKEETGKGKFTDLGNRALVKQKSAQGYPTKRGIHSAPQRPHAAHAVPLLLAIVKQEKLARNPIE
jgi:hypothetical protein